MGQSSLVLTVIIHRPDLFCTCSGGNKNDFRTRKAGCAEPSEDVSRKLPREVTGTVFIGGRVVNLTKYLGARKVRLRNVIEPTVQDHSAILHGGITYWHVGG